MVQSLNGQATDLPTDLLASDDDTPLDAVAEPVERPDADPEPVVEPEEGDADPDPDDIDIVDDDDDAPPAEEQPAEQPVQAEADPDDQMTKREWRQTVARNAIAKVRQALRGEIKPEDLNASERLLYKDQKAWRDEVEKPVKQSETDAAWSRYASLWQANLTNPQQFNELWQDARNRDFWLQMEANRATLGLHPGIDPQTFREKFDEYNASIPGSDGTSTSLEVEEFYEELQDKRYWSDLSDEEKASLAPARFKGTTLQIVAAMSARAALLEAGVKARKAKRPVEQRVAEVNRTATNAKAATKGAPLGVVRGERASMTVQQIRELAAKGDPQGLRLYAKWKERRQKTA